MTGSVDDRGRELPRLALLRELTDGTVLEQVFAHGRVTRFELAATTGISKPTISESVRRLELAGVLVSAGEMGGRRGRVPTYYELSGHAGWVFGLEVDQAGTRVRGADLMGKVFLDIDYPPVESGDATGQITLLHRVVRSMVKAGASAHGLLRSAAFSVANPVDPVGQAIIAMPDSPFPEGHVRIDELLPDVGGATLLVDNDVNFAALAERASGLAHDVGSFAYLYVGAGMGMGLFIGDRLVRGAHGLAGEIGELTAPDARRPTLARVVSEAGFGGAEAPAVDVDAVLTLLDSPGPQAQRIGRLATAVSDAIRATCAVVDPELIVLGGPIGSHPVMVEKVRTQVGATWPGPLRIERSALGQWPALQGAVRAALERGRNALVRPT